MRKLLIPLLFALIYNGTDDCEKENCKGHQLKSSTNLNFHFKPDTTSLIRNPGMGWVMYDDANDNVAKAGEYWANQDEAARKYASVFYIRWRWSEMEPKEGKYAWKYDKNFKALIKGARDRKLKLAFRIYVDGQDNVKPGTPDFVRAAGAEGYQVDKVGGGKNWTPYLDDPVFQRKFSKFVKAFATEFDNNEKVDFVDGYNLGWWGEGHHLVFKNNANKTKVFDWIINLYGSSFKKVLLAITFGSEIGIDLEKEIALKRNGYIVRRDGVGSEWFKGREKAFLNTLFPETMFIAESCYWGCNTDDCTPWRNDPSYKKETTWTDVYTRTYHEAVNAHANYLDLREKTETKRWITRVPKLVEQFLIDGGYRFYPTQIALPAKIEIGKAFKIDHQWKNIGNGVCPNNNLRWDNQYKVAFALIDSSTKAVKKVFIDNDALISQWIKGRDYPYSIDANTDDVKPGSYYWGVAIVNTQQDNQPGITIAIDKSNLIKGWVKLSSVSVTPNP